MKDGIIYLWRWHLIPAILAILIVGPLAYMYFDDADVIELSEGQMIPPHVRAGDLITVRWRVTEKRSCPGTIIRRVVGSDGIVHEYDPVETVRHDQLAIDRTFSREFRVPLTVPPGLAVHTAKVEYYCNLLQYIFPLRPARPSLSFTVDG